MNQDYSITTDIRYPPLERIDIQSIKDVCTEQWFNQSLCKVNDSVVRLGIVEGEFHWHKHDDEDEFFYVIDGLFIVELEDRTVELGPRQCLLVPKGVKHCPRAPVPTMILMVEGAGVVPTGDLST